MTGEINNGRRESVTFGPYSGPAGIVERDGRAEVAFFGKLRVFKEVRSGMIGDAQYSIDKAEPGLVEGMVRLTVTPAITPEQTAVTA